MKRFTQRVRDSKQSLFKKLHTKSLLTTFLLVMFMLNYSKSIAQEADVPTISILDSVICQMGDSATINITGNLNSADKWYVSSESCGGALVDSTTGGDVVLFANTNTTYYIWGDGASVVSGPCDSVNVTFIDILDQTVALDNDLISCSGDIVNVMLGGSQADIAYLVRDNANGKVLSTQLGTGSAMDIPVSLNNSMDLDVLAVPTSGANINSTYINFDGGNDYIQVPYASQLDLTDQFIISFKFRSKDAAQTNNYLLSKGGNRYAVLYGYVANTIELFGGSVDVRTGSQITVPDMDWHQYVYAYDGTTLRGYIDGVEVVTVAKSITLATDVGDFFIGAANAGTGYSTGDMDNVEIWNQYNAARLSELLSGECSAITDSTGLAALYMFEDGSGSVASDYSGYSNHGTLNNMTLTSAWQSYTNTLYCNTCTEQLSQIVSVTVDRPTITTQPVSTGGCSGEPASFFIESSDAVDEVIWQYDGGTGGASWFPANTVPNASFSGDSILFSGITGDVHGAGFRAIIYKCGIPQDTSEIATLTVYGYSSNVTGIDVCYEYVTSNGAVYTESGFYTDTIYGAGVFGCDSIFWIMLNVLNEETPHRTIYPTTCTYVGPSGTTYTGPDIHYDTLVGANPVTGCDSIIAIDFRPVCDTITDYRLISGTNKHGNGNYFFYSSVDSSRFAEKATQNSSFHSLSVHPASGYLHAIIDSLGDGNRSLYKFNPFTSEMTLLYEFPDSYVSNADYGPDGTLYFVYGWNSESSMEIWKLDSAKTTLTLLSEIIDDINAKPNLEYFDSKEELMIYDDNNYVHIMDPTSGGYNTYFATGLRGMMVGAYYNSRTNNVTCVDSDGNFYETDTTGLNGRVTRTEEEGLSDIVEFNTLFPMQDTIFMCKGDSVQLSVRYHANTVKWYKDGVPFATNKDTVYISAPGKYRAMHQIGTSNKWVWSEEKVVEYHEMPELNLSTADEDTLLCPGETIQINSGTGGDDFQWYLNGNPIVSANSITYTANLSGRYNITKTYGIGCVDSATIAITLYDATPTSSTIDITETENSYIAPDGAIYTQDGQYQAIIENVAGCDSTITINLTFDTSTNILSNNQVNKISIYPTPTLGRINIDLAERGNYNVQVYAITGRLIFKEEYSSSQKINFSLNAEPGIYNLVIISDRQVLHNKKLIVE